VCLDSMNTGFVCSKPAGGAVIYLLFLCVVLSCVGGGLVVGHCRIQGVQLLCLKELIVSEVHSES
jgi:hypothetical protein